MEVLNDPARAPVTLPPPPVTENTTGTPGTPLPSESRITTAGDTATAVLTVADWPPPSTASMDTAAPTPTATGPEVAEAKPSAAKMSVRMPGRPRMERSVKVTVPLALLATLVVPPRVPPPVAICTVTTTPGRASGAEV